MAIGRKAIGNRQLVTGNLQSSIGVRVGRLAITDYQFPITDGGADRVA
jgi:hypothetical protein